MYRFQSTISENEQFKSRCPFAVWSRFAFVNDGDVFHAPHGSAVCKVLTISRHSRRALCRRSEVAGKLLVGTIEKLAESLKMRAGRACKSFGLT